MKATKIDLGLTWMLEGSSDKLLQEWFYFVKCHTDRSLYFFVGREIHSQKHYVRFIQIYTCSCHHYYTDRCNKPARPRIFLRFINNYLICRIIIFTFRVVYICILINVHISGFLPCMSIESLHFYYIFVLWLLLLHDSYILQIIK